VVRIKAKGLSVDPTENSTRVSNTRVREMTASGREAHSLRMIATRVSASGHDPRAQILSDNGATFQDMR